jgi:hypothetical protein
MCETSYLRRMTDIWRHHIRSVCVCVCVCGGGGMMFNATFNNISVISWRSVLLVEEIGVLGENHPPVASH